MEAPDPPATRRAAVDWRTKGKDRPCGLGLALQGEHVGVAVDDAGLGREQGGGADQIGLQRQCLGTRQHAHALNAVGLGAGLDASELVVLLG